MVLVFTHWWSPRHTGETYWAEGRWRKMAVRPEHVVLVSEYLHKGDGSHYAMFQTARDGVGWVYTDVPFGEFVDRWQETLP